MFFRTKTSGPRTYLQIVENRWENGRSRQRVVATLGRLDQLQQTGQLDALLASGARLAQSVLLLSAHTPKDVFRPSRRDASAPPSSSRGSGSRRAANTSLHNGCRA